MERDKLDAIADTLSEQAIEARKARGKTSAENAHILKTLSEVRDQTIKTNGRVSALEEHRSRHEGWMAKLEDRLDGNGLFQGKVQILQTIILAAVFAAIGAYLKTLLR